MPPKFGYLLPTREQIMDGHAEAASLLALAGMVLWYGGALSSGARITHA